MKNLGECYYDHYTTYLKNPVGRNVFRQNRNSPSIQILSYENIFRDCMVFCSLGLTHYHEKIKQIGEILLVVDAGWQVAPTLLANTLFYIIQKSMILGSGMSISGISNIDPVFVQEFNKQAIYITQPFGFPDDFGLVKCGNMKGYIYLGILISEAEHAYFVENGASKFETLLEESNVDVYDVNRPSIL